MRFACKINDGDCATGKTFDALSRCFSTLKKTNYVYAVRTKELANDIFKRAKFVHNIPENQVTLIVGNKSANKLKNSIKNKTHKFIVTTHDTLNFLKFVNKTDYVLYHDEKPSDTNIITVYDKYTTFITRYPVLKNILHEFKFDVEFRSEKFREIQTKYNKIGVFDKKAFLRFYRRICKNKQDYIDQSLVFFLTDLFYGNVEYFINEKQDCVRLLSWEPYNNWKDVCFLMAHSGIDSEHILPFIQKCKLYDVNYVFEGSVKSRLRYSFKNLEIHTANTYKRWSKNFYNKEDNFSKIITEINKKISENDKCLVLCNKGYENIIMESFAHVEILDHAPYGKEKPEYLSCNVIVNLAAKNRNLKEAKLLRDFGFSDKILMWDKADDIIQYLMRSVIREDENAHVKLFISDARTAELVSYILGIIAKPTLKIGVDDYFTVENNKQEILDTSHNVTILKSVRDKTGESFTFKNFDSLIDVLPKDMHKRKGCFMFSENGAGRSFNDIVKLSALTFDFDNKSKRPLTEENCCNQIRSNFGDVVFYIQRTFQKYNYRVIVPLDKNITPEYYQRVMRFIVSRIPNVDKSCCKPTQIYFASKYEIRKYGKEILRIGDLRIPSKCTEYRKIINIKGAAMDLNKAVHFINDIPVYDGIVKTNEFCLKSCKKLKKLIGRNTLTTCETWNYLFLKLEPYLKHEGGDRINDFIRYSYK